MRRSIGRAVRVLLVFTAAAASAVAVVAPVDPYQAYVDPAGEGRAWDWMPATDAAGDRHAMARRQSSWFTTTNRPGDWYPGGLAQAPRPAPDFGGDGNTFETGMTWSAQLAKIRR